MLKALFKRALAPRTRTHLRFDWLRWKARTFGPRRAAAVPPRMHLGSGARRIPGWLNVDVTGADVNIDLTARQLPFARDSFEAIVAQHLIEHLDLESEVVPVVRELYRILKPGGELWLATPDLAKVCAAYVTDGAEALYRYVETMDPGSLSPGVPHQDVINLMFHQRGLHRNLFDYELLAWALQQGGFDRVERVAEQDLLARFPGFPPRGDDFEALYVRCVK